MLLSHPILIVVCIWNTICSIVYYQLRVRKPRLNVVRLLFWLVIFAQFVVPLLVTIFFQGPISPPVPDQETRWKMATLIFLAVFGPIFVCTVYYQITNPKLLVYSGNSEPVPELPLKHTTSVGTQTQGIDTRFPWRVVVVCLLLYVVGAVVRLSFTSPMHPVGEIIRYLFCGCLVSFGLGYIVHFLKQRGARHRAADESNGEPPAN
jgi:predicted Na+-dependent transporter